MPMRVDMVQWLGGVLYYRYELFMLFVKKNITTIYALRPTRGFIVWPGVWLTRWGLIWCIGFLKLLEVFRPDANREALTDANCQAPAAWRLIAQHSGSTNIQSSPFIYSFVALWMKKKEKKIESISYGRPASCACALQHTKCWVAIAALLMHNGRNRRMLPPTRIHHARHHRQFIHSFRWLEWMAALAKRRSRWL